MDADSVINHLCFSLSLPSCYLSISSLIFCLLHLFQSQLRVWAWFLFHVFGNVAHKKLKDPQFEWTAKWNTNRMMWIRPMHGHMATWSPYLLIYVPKSNIEKKCLLIRTSWLFQWNDNFMFVGKKRNKKLYSFDVTLFFSTPSVANYDC